MPVEEACLSQMKTLTETEKPLGYGTVGSTGKNVTNLTKAGVETQSTSFTYWYVRKPVPIENVARYTVRFCVLAKVIPSCRVS